MGGLRGKVGGVERARRSGVGRGEGGIQSAERWELRPQPPSAALVEEDLDEDRKLS